MNKTHGDTGTRLNNIWKGMKHRCSSKPEYSHISVCDEWKSSYESFKKWALANGYYDKSSIDRIDNNSDYSPENCRWTNQLVQSANTRILYSHNKSGFRGVSWNKQYEKWETSISVKNKTIKVGYYSTAEEAAIAYDTYVKDNKLPHTVNGVSGRVSPNTGKILSTKNTSGFVGVGSPKRIAHLAKPWTSNISVGKKSIMSSYHKTALDAAVHRDKYIKENSLPNKRNFSDEELQEYLNEI